MCDILSANNSNQFAALTLTLPVLRFHTAISGSESEIQADYNSISHCSVDKSAEGCVSDRMYRFSSTSIFSFFPRDVDREIENFRRSILSS